jgi:hypothetical protein
MERYQSQCTFDRDGILRTLWEDPFARGLSRDLPDRLGPGEEYLDLQDLAAGVQQAKRSMLPSGGELSRKAVNAITWGRLLVYLHPAI